MDFWEYKLQKAKEFEQNSVVPEPPVDEMFLVTPDSEGKAGRVYGALHFSDGSAYLQVLERVVVRNNSIHRLRYAYTLMIDGVHEHGWERHATHDPAVHEHKGSTRTRKASKPISLKAVLDLCHERLSQRAEAPWEFEGDEELAGPGS